MEEFSLSFTHRPFQEEADFWRVRQLLVETYAITPPGFNWDIRRWDGWHFHREQPVLMELWQGKFQLWETADGRVIGAVHADSSGDAFLQIHPHYRHLIEDEMLAWAEQQLSVQVSGSEKRQLVIYSYEYDKPRHLLLMMRGYTKLSESFVIRRLHFGNQPMVEPALLDGYTLRSTRPGDENECRRMADLLNAAFNHDFHSAAEYRTFTNRSPSFRHDLNLVAEEPAGSFAAHVGVTFDDVNRRGIFEPVCTHPDHRRMNLARSLMMEGLRRLRGLGADYAYVATGEDIPANALYESVGFSESYPGYVWRKEWTSQPLELNI